MTPKIIKYPSALPAPSPQMNLLPGYFKARELLERAVKVDEAKEIRNRAEAFRAYAVKARNREMEALAAELRMRAERKAGQILTAAAASGERADGNGRPISVPGREHLMTLEALGVTRKQSSEWQRVGALSEEAFEKRIAGMKASKDPFSTNRFLEVAFSSKTNEWMTPPEVLRAVVATLGTIDLDPCAEASGAKANVPALKHFTKKDNGLFREWRGRVFMNPPYGNEVGNWALKLIAEYREGRVSSAIALMPARTDTVWFRALGEALICFVHGRLHFSGDSVRGNGGAPFPSAIFYLGEATNLFAIEFAKMGDLYERVAARAEGQSK